MTKRVRTVKMKPMSTELRLECIEVLADYAQVRLTGEQFQSLMEKNPTLNNQLVKFNSPSDTMDREDLMGALAIELTGRDWPINMEGQEVFDAFHKTFVEACETKGYKYLGETL